MLQSAFKRVKDAENICLNTFIALHVFAHCKKKIIKQVYKNLNCCFFFLKKKRRKNQKKKLFSAPHKHLKAKTLRAPRAPACRPAAACQQSPCPRDHLNTANMYIKYFPLKLQSNAKTKLPRDDLLDGIRWIWTSVVWRPLVTGGS